MGEAEGLPAGLQLVGAFDADARLLALGRWVEGLLR
jgi:Asp-tRNA(Asn)/Glu-tRNA(Gln) amidotransferase A subunit family amidase